MNDPEGYESSKVLATSDAEYFFQKMVGEMSWKMNEKIMDYGCGTGSTGAKLILPVVESNDSTMFSVDISEEMVEYAKKTYFNSRISYAVGNVLDDDFPFIDVKFDKIFALYVLHFVRDYRKALQKFHALLKPGGNLGFTVFVSKLIGINRTLGEAPKWAKYLKGYETFIPEWIHNIEEIGELFKSRLEDVGFQLVNFQVQKRHFVYPSFEMMNEIHLSMNPFLKNIPDALLSDFKLEHRDFLINHPDVDLSCGKAQVNYKVLYAVVQKS